MLSKNRPSEDPGLQAVAVDDGPEVVPEFKLRAPLDHNSSLSRPERYFEPQQLGNENLAVQDERCYDAFLDAQAPEVALPRVYQDKPEEDVLEQRTKNLGMCGMRRAAFVGLLTAIFVVVATAAVLGGVLGGVLHKHNSQQTAASNVSISGPGFVQTQAIDKTGLALMSPDQGVTLYSYYMDIDGDVLEVQWEDGLWLTSGYNVSQAYVVTGDVAANSPLAAVAYTLNFTTYRQLFFFDNNGVVTTVNTTAGSNWSQPYNVLPNATSQPNTLALAAIADTQTTGLDGIRLYYGSTDGVIQELGVQFFEQSANPVWHTFALFPDSDPKTGVACVLKNGTNHVYMRNSSTSALQQWQWDYAQHDTAVWQTGASTPLNEDIAEGADVALTTDGISTDYIFYQNTNNQTIRALYYGQNISDFVSDLDLLNAAPLGYKLAATWSTGSSQGAVALTQNSTAPTDLFYFLVARNGQAEGGTSFTAP